MLRDIFDGSKGSDRWLNCKSTRFGGVEVLQLANQELRSAYRPASGEVLLGNLVSRSIRLMRKLAPVLVGRLRNIKTNLPWTPGFDNVVAQMQAVGSSSAGVTETVGQRDLVWCSVAVRMRHSSR